MMHKPANYRPRYDDAEASPDARLTAALMGLCYWLARDEAGDAMQGTLAEEVSESLVEGTPLDDGTAEGIEAAIKDNLDADYCGNPEACLSYIMASVADKRKKEQKKC